MADDGRITKKEAIDRLMSITAGREHLSPSKLWRKLDMGEYKLRAVFPNTLLTTGFSGAARDGIAFVNLYHWSELKNQYNLVIQIEENIHEFPSEHMIAQIALVAS